MTAHTFLPSNLCLFVRVNLFPFLFDSSFDARLIYFEEILIARRPQRQPPLDSCPPRLTVIEAFEEMTDDSAREVSFVTGRLAYLLSESRD